MGRKPDPARRAEILAALADHLVKHGLAELTVRSAAAALGTSPQLLLYHFQTKERLLSETIAAIRVKHQAELARLLPLVQDKAAGQMSGLRLTWRWWTHERMTPYLRLFFEVYALAIRNPRRYRRHLDLIDADHRASLETGLGALGAPGGEQAQTLGTFYYAAFRGLILDLLTTGDRARVDAAVIELDRTMHEQLRAEQRVRRAAVSSRSAAAASARAPLDGHRRR